MNKEDLLAVARKSGMDTQVQVGDAWTTPRIELWKLNAGMKPDAILFTPLELNPRAATYDIQPSAQDNKAWLK